MTYRVSTTQTTETVAPVVEPVSLAEAKAHLRLDYGDEDTLVNSLIIAARQWVENYIQGSLVQRTYRADVEGFAGRFRLPHPPLLSITSIKYYTSDSPQVLTTLDANFYRADLGRGEIYIDASSATIPSTASRHDAVQISTDSPVDYAGNVPQAIKSAIKLLVGDMFELREVKVVGTIQSTSPTLKALLSTYREL
jgi:uncharacterized phiE125 gp8 family phage protein